VTILITASSVKYVGNGAQQEFAVNYKFFQDENLKVYVNDVLQTFVTDYTISNSNEETGSSVTFVLPPDDQLIIAIDRVLPNQQLLDLIEYDRFPAESVESALDWIVLLVQQNSQNAANALTASPSMPADVDLTVPIPGNGEYWRWADDGLSIVTTDITLLEGQIIPNATDTEITNGVEATVRLISPAQVKLGVETHETPMETVDALPGTPTAGVYYFVKQP